MSLIDLKASNTGMYNEHILQDASDLLSTITATEILVSVSANVLVLKIKRWQVRCGNESADE